MENKVIEVIDALCERFGIAVDWTSQNVFPYVKDLMERIIQYEVVTSIFNIVFSFTACFISFVFMKNVRKKQNSSEDSIMFTSILFAILLIISVIISPCQFYDIIEVLTIPEKTFIDIISTYGG